MSKKRKPVSFRTSDDDYLRLHLACGTNGIHEVDRAAVSNVVDDSFRTQLAIDAKLQELRGKLHQLTQELDRLAIAIAKSKGATSS